MSAAEEVEEVIQEQVDDHDDFEAMEEVGIFDIREQDDAVLVEAKSSQWIVGNVTEELLERGYFIRARDRGTFTGNLGFFIHETSEVVENEEETEPEAVKTVREILDNSYYMPYEGVDLGPDGDVRVRCEPNRLGTDTASNLQEAGFYTVAISNSMIYLREGDE